jgi:hypothetical protein
MDPKYKKCLSETWIGHPPNTLFFTLNRVEYDKKSNSLVKNNSFFHFEKEVYADMFLYKNKEKTY